MKKKKKQQKFPRTYHSTVNKEIITTKEQGLFVNWDKNHIFLSDKNGIPYPDSDISAEKTYRGERKTRVITKAFGLEGSANCVGEWIKNYDVVYAVDTNTKEIHNGKRNLSVGIVYKGEITRMDEVGGTIRCNVYAGFMWVWADDRKIEPENWVCAIKKIQSDEPADRRIALIVDSDLGNLEAYSSRTIPLSGNFFLPDNFSLLYASADYSDEWTNQMIRLCDKAATVNLEHYMGFIEKIDMNAIPCNITLSLEMSLC